MGRLGHAVIYHSVALTIGQWCQTWDRYEAAGWEIIKLEPEKKPENIAYAYLRRPIVHE
jgi:hypothetical protein